MTPPRRRPRGARPTPAASARIAISAALLLATAAGCERSPAPGDAAEAAPEGPPWFVECAEERGLRFVHHSGHDGVDHLMPEIMGGGAALLDLDGDGDLDAYLVQSGRLGAADERGANALFLNDGRGMFTPAPNSGAEDRGYGMGVAAGDYDGDGDLDLYVTNVGPNALLRNDGGARFTDVTAEAGVGHDGWGTSAAFLDYDGDGDLDLYVANYLRWSEATEVACYNVAGGPDYCSPKSYAAPAADVLYRNDGAGRFTDVSAAAGLGSGFGNGLGVVVGDFDGDALPDVFVANDGTPDQLWTNRGDGTFEDRALLAGCAIDLAGMAKAGMGVAAADIDDDGDLDLLVVNLRDESDSLYRNEGRWFADATAEAGFASLTRPYTRFGLAFADFDHDGRLDVFEATGRVQRFAPLHSDDPYAEPNLVLRGGADGRFSEVLPRGGTATPLIASARGAAFGDVDGDGAIDVLVVNRDAPAHLLRNVAPKSGSWIMLDLRDAQGAPAIGATVVLRTGARRITRDVRSAYSYCAANDPRVHVGLGAAERVDAIEVRWPDGTTESFGASPANREVLLQRGRGAGAESD